MIKSILDGIAEFDEEKEKMNVNAPVIDIIISHLSDTDKKLNIAYKKKETNHLRRH